VGHSGLAAENEMALDDVLVWSRRRIEEGRADA
jgi:hypothetical protein